MGYPGSLKADVEHVKKLLGRKGSGVPGTAALDHQLTWLLFLRVVAQRESVKESSNPRYRSPLPPELRWHRLPIPAKEHSFEALRELLEDTVLPGLRELPGDQPLAKAIRAVFQVAKNHVKKDWMLASAWDRLTELAIGSEAGLRGVAEASRQLLDEIGRTEEGGHSHTPSVLTDFVVQQVDPRPGERIVDPACGTGGFLLSALDHLRRSSRSSGGTDALDATVQACIHGMESRSLPYSLCVANLVLSGMEVIDGVRQVSALRAPGLTASADVVLLNLLVAKAVDKSVDGAVPAAFRSPEAADRYFYLAMDMLRPGGRAGMIVPDGFLSGEGVTTRLREKLLEECELHTVVRLPKGVFVPHTASKTSILFFTKGKPTRKIWYYQHPYPPGYKSYTKTKPIRREHLEPERSWWSRRTETAQSWPVSIEEIKIRNHDLDVRRPPSEGGEGPSRLLELNVRGFRGFSSLRLRLPEEGPAVLIGENGAGKSTVLDAIAMLLSSFTALASGSSARQAEVPLKEGDVLVGAPGATVSATLRVGRAEQFWDIGLSRLRGAAVSGKEIARQAEVLRARLLRSDPPNLPILCSYSVNRGLGDENGARRGSRTGGPIEAYEHAFRGGLGSFQDFLHWFRREEDLENQLRLRDDPEHRNPRLEVVRRAFQGFLHELDADRFSDLRIERSEDAKEGALVMEKGDVPLRIEQLSEGERNTLLLVSDIARRLAIANPGLEDPLRGAGIVLIDEIDLHLHPAWQRGILPALCGVFPGCQFIVTTHSAQVLGRVRRESVFILEDFELVSVAPHTYGRDANSILGEAMGVPERPKDIAEKIHHASVLIDGERLEEARTALAELESILGQHDVEVVRLRTMLLFLTPPSEG